jgi:ricin-type beta-trefoil lectin protein/subtilase family protein
VRATLLTRPAVTATVVAVVGALGMTIPATASATPVHAVAAHHTPATVHGTSMLGASRRAPLPSNEHYVCPAPARPGQMECMSIMHALPGGVVPAIAHAQNNFYGPTQLRSAYKLTTASAKRGKGETIAIVDAFRDPNAASDLARYRSHFHLKACTTGSGCLKIVNENGKSSPLPATNKSWAEEESLDLDMVSAICPNCKIMLFEANSSSTFDLGTAENSAIKKGARFVSNSWSGGEFFGQDVYNRDFNHPGDVIDFAAGDDDFGPAYPTDLQYVTAVGGTALKHASNGRGWTESAWGNANPALGGTGGGCSALEPKASWQTQDDNEATGCLNRTENDVSANADPSTGVLVFDSFKVKSGFYDFGGTSEATPIITAVYALAGDPTRGSYPAQYPYLHTNALFDVTSGLNGTCESYRQYLCHGKPGYDGPTGLGTPNGTAAFSNGSAHRVAVIDPGVQDLAAGSKISLQLQAVDTKSGAKPTWSASGLPGGLSISSGGKITGTLPATASTSAVTATAKDGSVSGTTQFRIVTVTSVTGANPPSADLVLAKSKRCLDGGSDASGQSLKLQNCSAGRITSQAWQYVATGKPDSSGTLQIAGQCVTATSATKVDLSPCSSGAKQTFIYLGFGSLWNPFFGTCLNSAQGAGSTVGLAGCNFGPDQSWNLPAGPIVVATSSGPLCLENTGGSTVQLEICDYPDEAGQLWTLEANGTIKAHGSAGCLSASSVLSETAMRVGTCSTSNALDVWETGPQGSLMNFVNKCLADQNNGGSGSTAVQNDCYGDLGEVWGLN